MTTDHVPTAQDVLNTVNEAMDKVEWAIAQYNQSLRAKAEDTPLAYLRHITFEAAITGAAQHLKTAERLVFGWKQSEQTEQDQTTGVPTLGSMRINDEDDTRVLFEL